MQIKFLIILFLNKVALVYSSIETAFVILIILVAFLKIVLEFSILSMEIQVHQLN